MSANTQTNGPTGEFPADLLVQLDRSRPRSLRIQLERGLRQSIARGSLPAGTALPPSRVLAAELDVSRSLVVGAYEQLVMEGYLEARQGSGTRVRAQGSRGDGAADHESYGAGPAPAARDGGIRRSGLPDPALFPAPSGCATTATCCGTAPTTGCCTRTHAVSRSCVPP